MAGLISWLFGGGKQELPPPAYEPRPIQKDLRELSIDLYHAVNNGSLQIVKELLDQGANLIFIPQYLAVARGETLNRAIRNGYYPVVKELLERGGGEASYVDQDTLASVIRNNRYDILKELLDRGADITRGEDQALDTVVELLIKNPQADIKILDAILTKWPNEKGKNYVLSKMSSGTQPFYVDYLLKNYRFSQDQLNEALHLVLSSNRPVYMLGLNEEKEYYDVVKDLLDAGAQPFYINRKGEEIKPHKYISGRIGVLLLSRAPNLTPKQLEEYIPTYHQYYPDKNLEFLRYLLQRGAHLSANTRKEAIRVAKESHSREAVELLSRYPDYEPEERKEYTPRERQQYLLYVDAPREIQYSSRGGQYTPRGSMGRATPRGTDEYHQQIREQLHEEDENYAISREIAYQKLTIPQIKALLDQRRIRYNSRMRKQELIDLLVENE